ncbi:hypothetical protein [Chryseobacterium taeanense]|uniref:hypothetical protein n=1 Tax=Chryseobacterium taeanense TaxID=311334 RepID=UPI0035B31AE2
MIEFKLGDIIKGESTVHPIIFFSKMDDDNFYGAIITHSTNYENNVAMQANHFIESQNNMSFSIQYDNSYLVKLKIIKYSEWGPYEKRGQLSELGIEFIKSHLENEDPILWSQYLR